MRAPIAVGYRAGDCHTAVYRQKSPRRTLTPGSPSRPDEVGLHRETMAYKMGLGEPGGLFYTVTVGRETMKVNARYFNQVRAIDRALADPDG